MFRVERGKRQRLNGLTVKIQIQDYSFRQIVYIQCDKYLGKQFQKYETLKLYEDY